MNIHIQDRPLRFIITIDEFRDVIYPGIVFLPEACITSFSFKVKRLADDQGEALVLNIGVKPVEIFKIFRHGHFHQEDFFILGNDWNVINIIKSE